MKKNNRNYNYDEYDEDEMNRPKKKEDKKKRPVRNWKKVWDSHGIDCEELDEFHN